MAKINEVNNIVHDILLNKPETRSDDYLLIYEVLKKYVNENVSLSNVCLNHVYLGLPSLETITRCRRKLQKDYPYLISPEAQAIRNAEIEEYKQYALDIK